MGFKQKEARRLRRATRPANVQRTVATRNAGGGIPVVHGTNAVYHTPVVWAVVCPKAKLAEHTFDKALDMATIVEITQGHGPECVNRHHIEMVPFTDTTAAATQTYEQWVRA